MHNALSDVIETLTIRILNNYINIFAHSNDDEASLTNLIRFLNNFSRLSSILTLFLFISSLIVKRQIQFYESHGCILS